MTLTSKVSNLFSNPQNPALRFFLKLGQVGCSPHVGRRIFVRLTLDRDIASRRITIINNADPTLTRYLQYQLHTTRPSAVRPQKAMSSPPRSLGNTFANSRHVWNVPTVNTHKVRDEVLKLWNVPKSQRTTAEA